MTFLVFVILWCFLWPAFRRCCCWWLGNGSQAHSRWHHRERTEFFQPASQLWLVDDRVHRSLSATRATLGWEKKKQSFHLTWSTPRKTEPTNDAGFATLLIIPLKIRLDLPS